MKVFAYCAVAGLDCAWAFYFAVEIVQPKIEGLSMFASTMLLAFFLAGAFSFILVAISEAHE